MGQKDYLPAVLEALDADLLFAGVAQKPGSPMLAGTVGGKLVFCLSGNPFAAAATLEQYAIPALLRAAGRCEEGCLLPRTTSSPGATGPLPAGSSTRQLQPIMADRLPDEWASALPSPGMVTLPPMALARR